MNVNVVTLKTGGVMVWAEDAADEAAAYVRNDEAGIVAAGPMRVTVIGA